MKRIANVQITDPFTCEAFTIQSATDREVIPVAEGGDGVMMRPTLVPLTTLRGVRSFLNAYARFPGVEVSLEDSSKAMTIFGSLRKADIGGWNYIEFSDDHYEWLLSIFKVQGTKLFGINTAAVLDAFRLCYLDPATLEVAEAQA